MDSLRKIQLEQLASDDEDIALQLESEKYLDPEMEKERNAQRFEEWIEEEGARYIAPKANAPDPGELEKLSEEIDF